MAVLKWCKRLQQVKKSMNNKREHLNIIFNREAKIMLEYYQSKSKGKTPTAKKFRSLTQKIETIDQKTIDMVLDEYFKACYNYYKRQMRIWILLAHKYLKSASIEAKDRRFALLEIVNPSETHDLKDSADGGTVAKYPIELSYTESQ